MKLTLKEKLILLALPLILLLVIAGWSVIVLIVSGLWSITDLTGTQ